MKYLELRYHRHVMRKPDGSSRLTDGQLKPHPKNYIGYYYSRDVNFNSANRVEGEGIIYILDDIVTNIVINRNFYIGGPALTLEECRTLNTLYRERKTYNDKINTLIENEIVGFLT